MQGMVNLAIDLMGGDFGPLSGLRAVENCLHSLPDVCFYLCGLSYKRLSTYLNGLNMEEAKDNMVLDMQFLAKNQQEIEALYLRLNKHPRVKFIEATEVVNSADNPIDAVRSKKDSSMHLAINLVKENLCQAVLSAGNTGAYMALAKIKLGMLRGFLRPAILKPLPTLTGTPTVMLDLGANVLADANNLKDFALLGHYYSQRVLGVESPSVGLLNIGTESNKGGDVLQEAFKLLKAMPELNFIGFVEGFDLTSGKVNVVVTDGFTGNVALKTLEGGTRLIYNIFKTNLLNLPKWRLFFVREALQRVRLDSDPRKHNGAILAGLRGVVVKAHGSSDEISYINALIQCYNLAKTRVWDF